MQWHSSGLSWEAVVEEHVLAPCSRTIWGVRGYPHLGTAEEGLEGECQVGSVDWMLFQHWLGESLEG